MEVLVAIAAGTSAAGIATNNRCAMVLSSHKEMFRIGQNSARKSDIFPIKLQRELTPSRRMNSTMIALTLPIGRPKTEKGRIDLGGD